MFIILIMILFIITGMLLYFYHHANNKVVFALTNHQRIYDKHTGEILSDGLKTMV